MVGPVKSKLYISTSVGTFDYNVSEGMWRAAFGVWRAALGHGYLVA